MERYRLKTIMILILSILNAFLLFYLFRRSYAEYLVRRKTEENLTALYAADSISLTRAAISHRTPPSPVRLLWDEDAGANAAAFFLKKSPTETQGEGEGVYTEGDTTARFREDGSFSVSGLSIREDAEQMCRRFCRKWSLEEPDLPVPLTGTCAVAARYAGLPVFNCLVFFTFEDGVLTEVSGSVPVGREQTLESETPLLSASGALTAFQLAWRERHVVASSIRSTSLCMSLERSGEAAVLTPAWCVETDAVNYYVNCVTGEVTTE